MNTHQIKTSYLRLLGWIILSALVLGAIASCEKPKPQPPKYCWECQMINMVNHYGYSTIDTMCGMSEDQIRAYEAAHLIDNDSVQHSVQCHQVGMYR